MSHLSAIFSTSNRVKGNDVNLKLRTLALTAITSLMLAACGTPTEETGPTEQGTEQGATESVGDESEAWPFVEDENGYMEDDPQAADVPLDDGGDDSTLMEGDDSTVEFDGMTRELDMDALREGTWDLESPYYAESSTGAKYLIEFNAEGPEDLESYRERAGGAPASYVRIDIDNTGGMSEATAGNLIVVDAEGSEFEYETAFIAMDEWDPSMHDDGPEDVNDGYYYTLTDGTEISEEEYTPLQNEGVDLYNELLDTSASPRAKQTIWLIGAEPPTSLAYFGLDDGSDPLFGMPLLP